ncbi:MAG TPA: YetF domain-containing protein [Holophaga sp.]|nr:YetF domain-containing protein [Holophaga sp.]
MISAVLLPVGESLWRLGQPWWEFVLRALLVYGFLLGILRLTGKRQVSQMSPLDLVLLLVLSNAVQNSMNAGDNTVAAGFILVATLVALNAGLGWLTFKSKSVENLVEGKPLLLVHNGVVIPSALAEERVTRHELMAALRTVGLSSLDEVHVAVLESNGRISVIPRSGSSGKTGPAPTA